MSDHVRVSNREIYDALMELKETVVVHNATFNLRLQAVENKPFRSWKFWVAILGSPLFGALLAYVGIKTGAS